MPQSPVSLQDIFATVPDPAQVQQQLVKQQMEQLAQMKTQEEQFGFNLGNAFQRLGRRWKTGHSGDGVFHRLKTGDPTHPQVGQAVQTQQALQEATNVTGEKAEGETNLEHEMRLLTNFRARLNDKTNPQTMQAVTARISALQEEMYQRTRLEEADDRARSEEQRKAEAARLDNQLAELRISQLEKINEFGGDQFVVLELPDGTQLDRRQDDPVTDQLVRRGAKVLGTRDQIRQGELEMERIEATGANKPRPISNTEVENISALFDLTRQTLRADENLQKINEDGGTGIFQSWLGFRDWLVEKTDWLAGEEHEAWRQFQDAERQMRPLFQQLAKGNPSDRENEYFTRAVFDTKKGSSYNQTIIDGLLGMYADRAKLIYSTLIQNNKPVPIELVGLMKQLGVDAATVDASYNMADYERAMQDRLDQLERIGGSERTSETVRVRQPAGQELTPEQQAAVDRLLAE